MRASTGANNESCFPANTSLWVMPARRARVTFNQDGQILACLEPAEVKNEITFNPICSGDFFARSVLVQRGKFFPGGLVGDSDPVFWNFVGISDGALGVFGNGNNVIGAACRPANQGL